MEIQIEGKRQLKCDGCSQIMAESSYYPEKRGSLSFSLKNDEGDYDSYDLHDESCARQFLNSRHEAKSKSAQASDKQISIGRDGMVTLDFSRVLKDKK